VDDPYDDQYDSSDEIVIGAVLKTQEPAGSPMWWLQNMYPQLCAQAKTYKFYDRYYTGDHPLPWLAPQAHEDFRRILKMSRSNYMGLVCDATAERSMPVGFRLGVGEEKADTETWRLWQANNLDNCFDQGILESLICGQAYTLVAPNKDDPATPHIWVEHPSQAIVAYKPGSNRTVRSAGLKVWLDDWTSLLMATLYLPDAIYKYKARDVANIAALQVRWVPRNVTGETWPAKNPLGIVTLVEIPNNPRLLTGGVSELHDVTDIQDRVNKTIADRLMTQDFGAFPQKWASGWPEQDQEGNPAQPINSGRNRMVTTDVAEAKFGQWDAAPLDPYSMGKREDVKDIASRTRTPAQYLLGEMNNVNGETLKASESGLISKVRQRHRPWGEGLEETMRIARRAAGLPDAGGSGMETMWRNPEYRTEGELVDGLVKMATLDVPRRALWERWGATGSGDEPLGSGTGSAAHRPATGPVFEADQCRYRRRQLSIPPPRSGWRQVPCSRPGRRGRRWTRRTSTGHGPRSSGSCC